MFNNLSITSATLPMMVVKNIVPLPNNEIRFDVANASSKEALLVARNSDKYIALFVSKLPVTNKDEELKNLIDTGVVCQIISYVEGNIANARLLGITRCKLDEVKQTEPYYFVSVTTLPKQEDLIQEESDYVKLLAKELEKAGYSLDVRNSVLRFTEEASNGINNVSEGQKDDVLTLVNIDYFEYEDDVYKDVFHTNAILTFEDENNKKISVTIETSEEWKTGNHWSEDSLLNEEKTISLLTTNN